MVERHTQAEIDMIDSILKKLQIERGWLVDVGAHDGIFQSSTRHLLFSGWDALLIEADDERFELLLKNTQQFLGCRTVHRRILYLDAELIRAKVPNSFDLLCIDIDGQDWWVWRKLLGKPKVIAIEYNSNFEPGECAVVPEDPEFRWSGDTFYGASAMALWGLGRKKGYTLVGQTPFSNLYFVRNDLAGAFTPLDPMEIPMERIHPVTSKSFLCWSGSWVPVVEV